MATLTIEVITTTKMGTRNIVLKDHKVGTQNTQTTTITVLIYPMNEPPTPRALQSLQRTSRMVPGHPTPAKEHTQGITIRVSNGRFHHSTIISTTANKYPPPKRDNTPGTTTKTNNGKANHSTSLTIIANKHLKGLNPSQSKRIMNLKR